MTAASAAEVAIVSTISLPALIDRAISTLANARSAAEVLDARDQASAAYKIAKVTLRLARAKRAHDDVIAAAFRSQADALEIEARAKRRLADEYDAAQERGEAVSAHAGAKKRIPNGNSIATTADLGLSSKDIHDAREVRDAEEADPGIVRRTLDEALDQREEPTRAKVKRAVKAKSKRRRFPRRDPNSPTETQHDRDLRMLLGVWESACETARQAFLETVTTS